MPRLPLPSSNRHIPHLLPAATLALLALLQGCGGGAADPDIPVQATAAAATASALDARADVDALAVPLAGQRSTQVGFSLNLDPSLPPNPLPLFDPADPRSYELRLAVPVYGARGEEIGLGLYLRRQATAEALPGGLDRWQLFFTANQQLLDDAPVLLAFGPDGRLSAGSPQSATLNLPPLPLAGAGLSDALAGLRVHLHHLTQHRAVPGQGFDALDSEVDFPQVDGQPARPARVLAANTRQDAVGISSP